MNYNEFMETIAKSSMEEWLYDDATGHYLYLNNISITMDVLSEDDNDDDEFYESWLKNFIKSEGKRHIVRLKYNGGYVTDFYTVAVDGYRMYIPYPKTSDMSITKIQYGIGQIINKPLCYNFNEYDSYLKQAGISVK